MFDPWMKPLTQCTVFCGLSVICQPVMIVTAGSEPSSLVVVLSGVVSFEVAFGSDYITTSAIRFYS